MSSNNRTRAVASALAAVVAGLCVAAVAAAAPKADVTLRLSWQAGYNVPLDALIANFEKAYPSIHITTEFAPIATYGQQIQTEFQGGNGPDLIYGSPGSGNTNGLGILEAQGHLADLSNQPYARRIKQYPLVWDKKKLYALPIAAFPIGALYNKAVLGSHSIPTTFNQFLALCHALKSEGKYAIGLSGAAPNLFAASLAANWVYGPQPNWNDLRAAHKVTFASSPGWKTTLERFVALKDNDCFPPGVPGLQIPQAIGMLGAGQSLLSILPGDASASISAGFKSVQLGMFPFPGDTAKSTSVPISFGQAIGVNKDSKHLKEAKQFVAFAARTGQSKVLAHYMGVPTLDEYRQGKLTPLLSGLAPAIKAKKTSSYAALTFPNAAVYTDLGTGFQGLLTGQLTIPQVLQKLDNAWDTGKP